MQESQYQDYIDFEEEEKLTSLEEHRKSIRFKGFFGEVTIKYYPVYETDFGDVLVQTGGKYRATIRQDNNKGFFVGDGLNRDTALVDLYQHIALLKAALDFNKNRV